MAGLLRSPLVVFALAGLALFVVSRSLDGALEDGVTDEDVIVVEREALLDFVQLRSGEADAAALAARWDGLEAAARQVWVDRFVREEALVREARRLGLDREDDLIRRRLVQQMEFLVAGDAEAPIDAASLAAAFTANVEDHRVPAIVTFAHVFVRDPDALTKGEASRAHARAESLRAALNADGLGFDEAGDRGDRFLYNRVYVDRTLDEVRAHFGPEMAARLASISPDAPGWQGPIASQHGWHVLRLRRFSPSRLPTSDELQPVLLEELRRARQEASLERGVRGILADYSVRVRSDVGASVTTGPAER
ncbi:MAG: peptidylprolyl isomerase [Myxococcota bacterium]